ncbi:DNA damage-regulated autophagy modulator protein 2 [Pocillopora verrucosa]|uniref:DNA damage-regulated autophagy modulator protein 2 n=1 Tax=Pocillopora verrucosa TaxID=203993 RepID=UPI0027975ED8|nr:DNA damage-regulated autophagy modulator protein 2-like [Pocillopora verrucosa]
MAPQGIGNLHFLPVVLGCFAIIAFFTAYGMSVKRKDVSAIWPYISDAGSRAPESCIFGQFLNMAAVIAFVVMYIHYRHVKEFNVTDMPIILKLNYWSLWIAAFTCLGLSMVANFQETNSLPTHLTGAIMVFGLGTLYCWMQAFISHLMRNQATSSALSSCTRFILSALITVFFIITLAAGGAASAAYKEQHNNKSDMAPELKWKKTDDGYNAHLASTFSEWLMSICFLLYFLTYFREFQKINVIIQIRPKNAEIFSSGQSHHDEARIVV